jgi:hypothetical protein
LAVLIPLSAAILIWLARNSSRAPTRQIKIRAVRLLLGFVIGSVS